MRRRSELEGRRLPTHPRFVFDPICPILTFSRRDVPNRGSQPPKDDLLVDEKEKEVPLESGESLKVKA